MKLHAIIPLALAILLLLAGSAGAGLYQKGGTTLSFLRVTDINTGYGPPNDFINAEVVILFTGQPNAGYGFQLRNDANGPTRRGMLDLLRDAYINRLNVTIDVEIPDGKQNGIIRRVWLTR